MGAAAYYHQLQHSVPGTASEIATLTALTTEGGRRAKAASYTLLRWQPTSLDLAHRLQPATFDEDDHRFFELPPRTRRCAASPERRRVNAVLLPVLWRGRAGSGGALIGLRVVAAVGAPPRWPGTSATPPEAGQALPRHLKAGSSWPFCIIGLNPVTRADGVGAGHQTYPAAVRRSANGRAQPKPSGLLVLTARPGTSRGMDGRAHTCQALRSRQATDRAAPGPGLGRCSSR